MSSGQKTVDSHSINPSENEDDANYNHTKTKLTLFNVKFLRNQIQTQPKKTQELE